MVIVFLNSKLLSADTILPFCIGYKGAFPHEKFRFFCVGSKKTVTSIRQNIILDRAICLTGQLTDIGCVGLGLIDKLSEKSSIVRKMVVAINLVWTLLHVFFFDAKVVHFRFWEHRLLKVFVRIKPANFFQFHSNCWGDNPEVDAANIADGRTTIDNPLICQGSVVSFHGYWKKYLDAKNMGLPTLLAAPTRASATWLKFLDESCADLVEKEKIKICYSSKKRPVTIVLNILNEATKCNALDSPKKCLGETLDTLWQVCPDRTVLMKPHIITDMEALEQVIKETKHENILITNMHLAILGQLSSLAICNLFSLGIADCWLSGCPTMEYTDYNEKVLDATAGRSFGKDFIDVFLSGDASNLKASIEHLISLGPIDRRLETDGRASMQQLIEFVSNPT